MLPVLARACKVFVLIGQSNMEGQGVVDLKGPDYNNGRGTLVALAEDPATAELVAPLRTGDGSWMRPRASRGARTSAQAGVGSIPRVPCVHLPGFAIECSGDRLGDRQQHVRVVGRVVP